MRDDLWMVHELLQIPENQKDIRGKHFGFCEYLRDQGRRITIITANRSHLLKRNVKTTYPIRIQHTDGIRIIYIKSLQVKKTNSLNRLLNWIHFAFWLFCLFIILRRPKTVFLSVLPQTIIWSYYWAYFWRRKPTLWLEIRDIWPMSGVELMNLNSKSLIVRLMTLTEIKGYRIADKILSPLLTFDLYLEKFSDEIRNKYMLFPNGILQNNYLTVTKNPIPNKKDSPNDRLKLGYFGGLNNSNNLEGIIKSLSSISIDFELNIYGTGSKKKLLESIPDSRLFIYNSVSRDEAIKIMKSMDFLLMGLHDLKVYRYGLASLKLTDYLVANKPILYVAPNYFKFFKIYGLGVEFISENLEELIDVDKNTVDPTNEMYLNIRKSQVEFLQGTMILDNYFSSLDKFLDLNVDIA